MLTPTSHGDLESPEILSKKYNFVIVGFGDLGKGWHQILTETGQQVYVCSLNGRQYNHDPYAKAHNVHAYNIYNLPIGIEEIDAVLMCVTATDLSLLEDMLPKAIKEKIPEKLVFFQNGIGTREKLKQILSIAHPTQVIPYFSFKSHGGKNIEIKLAKPSPSTGDLPTIKTLINAINRGPHLDPMFEGVDSIILRKEERKKGYINSFLNTISVIYDAPIGKALLAFTADFGPDAQEQLYRELLEFNNEIAGDELAHMEIQEIQEDIENAIRSFYDQYPSTYFQYYKKPHDRKEIHSDEQHFIGRIIMGCRYKNKHLPLLESLYNRMKAIKKSINSTL